jgi:hypothetical protein
MRAIVVNGDGGEWQQCPLKNGASPRKIDESDCC